MVLFPAGEAVRVEGLERGCYAVRLPARPDTSGLVEVDGAARTLALRGRCWYRGWWYRAVFCGRPAGAAGRRDLVVENAAPPLSRWLVPLAVRDAARAHGDSLGRMAAAVCSPEA